MAELMRRRGGGDGGEKKIVGRWGAREVVVQMCVLDPL